MFSYNESDGHGGTKLIKNIFSKNREEDYQVIVGRIRRNAKLRDNVIKKSESVEGKIIATPSSILVDGWREQINEISRILGSINNDLKDDFEKLTESEVKKLPDYLLVLRRFLL